MYKQIVNLFEQIGNLFKHIVNLFKQIVICSNYNLLMFTFTARVLASVHSTLEVVATMRHASDEWLRSNSATTVGLN